MQQPLWSCKMTHRLTKSFGTRSTCFLDGFLAVSGNVHRVAQEASGWIMFALENSLLIGGDIHRAYACVTMTTYLQMCQYT